MMASLYCCEASPWVCFHEGTHPDDHHQFPKAGLPGESHDVFLELKLLADVGLIGFPNVGKSTLLSVVSKAQPKIANYHFTTLYPNLGVVWVDEGVSFVMADIPGIIEGASEGAGLGHDFLRHIDRCRLLVHVVDVSGSEGRDPVADFDAINTELEQYSPDLAKRPQIVAANKVDIMTDPENLERLRAHVEATGSPRGKEILDNFSAFLPKFKKVLPYDYDRMLRVIASVEERGLDGEQAQIEAFYAVQKHQ